MMYVYVIRADAERVKIGKSQCPEARLAQLQTGAVDELQLVYTRAAKSPTAIEKAAHDTLKSSRIRGEWFGVSTDYAVAVIDDAIAAMEELDYAWLLAGGWQHQVGDVVECRREPHRGYPGPFPVAGQRYTVSAVYGANHVDFAEIPNEHIAFNMSEFWPLKRLG